MSTDHVIRPMEVDDLDDLDDLDDVERLAAEDDRAGRWLRHVVDHDPAGCWVAEDGGRLVGAVASVRRDLLWVLIILAVRPEEHGRGVGRALLQAAAGHGDGCLRAMASTSEGTSSVRLLHQAGFTLEPWMLLRGRVSREVLPVVDRVREGSAGDLDLLDSVDRRTREAAHGADHEAMLATHRLVVVERGTGAGYAYVETQGGPHLLAATNRRTATDLLWETLAASSPDTPCTIARVSAANPWAVDVGLSAGLALGTRGFLALRGMKAPAPYLASGHFM